MDAAFECSFSGMNMDFAIHLTHDGHPVLEGLFVNIVVEKMFTSPMVPQICCRMFSPGHQRQSGKGYY